MNINNTLDNLFESTSKVELSKIRAQKKKQLDALKKNTKSVLDKMKEQKKKALQSIHGADNKTRVANEWDNKIYTFKMKYYKQKDAISAKYESLISKTKAKYSKLNESQEDSSKTTYYIPPCLWLDAVVGHNETENKNRLSSYLGDESTLDIMSRGGKKYVRLNCTEDEFKKIFSMLQEVKWSYIAKCMNSDIDEVQDIQYYTSYHHQLDI